MSSTSYTERQRIEKEWHDAKYEDGGEGNRRVDTVSQKLWEIVGQPRGQTILDFGCGDGWVSVGLAKNGNDLHGFDISSALIERARHLAESSGVADRTTFKEMAAEELDYPNDFFDLVIGTSILHHVDLPVTLARIHSSLKANGTAIFLEPHNQNPALQLWRMLTPWRRTETERAFSREDLALVRRIFPTTRFNYYCLTSMFSGGLMLMAPKSKLLRGLNGALESFDGFLLSTFPSLGRFSAVTIMEMRK
jgi:2-polyprenyl-3-methyl-5-hydroxy-6-metoxy-1,4-benzoquinol methylase